ncbi:hypothetical protein HID58_037027 [Brassica napus]|uniref:BnaA09g51390D protein n=3 Tax=Brassica TaxID=3705 RepID=A0A078H4P7_BRANA|nr:hypothetical protein HID58_037027 [Brassica napus]CAF2052359.1 unnamed protein product [Brassica napus]CAG7867691.1 unnamed protein product [Brassica rapa]CDY32457.1 BnaA09g51390D [Brassica napus]VDC64607.1 unnamed protein product [Brassica rapa]
MDRRDLRKMLIDPGSTDSVVLEVKVWPQAIPDRSFDLHLVGCVKGAYETVNNFHFRGTLTSNIT